MAKVLVIYHSDTGNTRKMAELITSGAAGVEGVEAEMASISEVTADQIGAADAVAMGSPTYYGTMSWQMKQFTDTFRADFNGKLGTAFASAAWPGGGGYELVEFALIAAMLIKGMVIYTGGVVNGMPPTHFGAVSRQAPQGFDVERCEKLGRTFAEKARELFG